ncbi:MAG: GIY-YIG nuclease family protein [Synergistaceae bacterium]|nr:GIY-YIG nuclease family protein [Synergistaceae bacterium]
MEPVIYAYTLPNSTDHEGYIKIGFTNQEVHKRIKQQLQTSGQRYKLVFKESAVRPDGSVFKDSQLHELLRSSGFTRLHGGREWFLCSVDDVMRAYVAIRDRTYKLTDRVEDFTMREEQLSAVSKTAKYFASGRSNKFLWNAKMRFGKTFAAYQLCMKMDLKKILVLTFKPAVESAWSHDINSHRDFEGWQFISNHSGVSDINEEYSRCDKSKPIVVFGSFQDLLGRDKDGNIKAKNKFIHELNWDIVIFDEYHFGAWRDNAKSLFDFDEESNADFDPESSADDLDLNEKILPITSNYYLYLSGTPFRALNNGEFIEEQIYNWTYSDEQKMKADWPSDKGDNPYRALPKIIMMTYKIPDSIRRVAEQGEFDGFDLNKFFGTGDNGRFIFEDEVVKWLRLIRGDYLPDTLDNLKLGRDKAHMPYADYKLRESLRHTLWFLPDVASCNAMSELLTHDKFFSEYKIILCAGKSCGNGLEAFEYVNQFMSKPLESKSITLSCGKLTTGVTIKAWSGIFMLRNLKSPETYFQAAFRVQSSWTERNSMGEDEIVKPECYIFDFALDRALKQVADYSCKLDINADNPEKKVEEFIKFLPVLAFDGASMSQINARDILEMTLAGTSATLLAKRWESPLIVNVNNDILEKLKANERAMKALMSIQAFRSLNKEISTVINNSNLIKQKRRDGNGKTRGLTDEEIENIKLRKLIQEKLIKLAARIPAFMYLTDEREMCLADVIRDIEPELFTEVTGITVPEFDLLCELGVYNTDLISDAIYKFKCYEDNSLTYITDII